MPEPLINIPSAKLRHLCIYGVKSTEEQADDLQTRMSQSLAVLQIAGSSSRKCPSLSVTFDDHHAACTLRRGSPKLSTWRASISLAARPAYVVHSTSYGSYT